MKNKNKTFVKIFFILLIIIIVFVILFLIFFRKMFILNSLYSKISKLQDNNTKENIYVDIEMPLGFMKIYIKDNSKRTIIGRKDILAEMNEYTYPKVKKIFTETEDSKELLISKEKGVIDSSRYNILTGNFFNRLSQSLKVGIKTVKIDGIKCYEITNFYPDDPEDGRYKGKVAYVNSETGLPIKVIRRDYENGKLIEEETTFEIKFDCVTEEDMKELDPSGYKLVEPELEELR